MPVAAINPAEDLNPEPCPICGGSGVHEMRVADADKIDVPCPVCTCDRAELVIMRALTQGWVTVHNREMLKATIRIALDTEVRAGGPRPDKSAS